MTTARPILDPADDPASRSAGPAPDHRRELRLYGRRSSPAAYALRDFLARSVVSYTFIDLDDPGCGREPLPAAWTGHDPICVLPDGGTVLDAEIRTIARHLGWITSPQTDLYDLSIYGAGPAGLSAAVYAASEGLRVILIERHAVGGQAAWSSRIENYLGFPDGITGADLAERARQQAVGFGAEILQLREGIKAVFDSGHIIVDLADGTTLTARANICATGVEYHRLDILDEDRFLGAGLYYGAGLSESTLCDGERVVIIGGGNSAGQAALHLAERAASVQMLIRGTRPAASMSRYLLDRIEQAPNITIRTSANVTALHGTSCLQAVTVADLATGRHETVPTARVFVLIGGTPNTEWAADTAIVRHPRGYLVTGPDLLTAGNPPPCWTLPRRPYDLETSVPGSFAVGDVRHGSIKRVASAVGEGALAVHLVHRWLDESHRS